MAGRPSKTQSLAVWLNGERVGDWDIPANAEASFTYALSWFDSPAFRPVSLSLPALRANPTVKGAQVTAFFDNLLPDSEVIRRRLQAKFRTRNTGAAALLAAVGRDCVGAVQIVPADEAPADTRTIDAVVLDEAGVEHMLLQAVSSPNAMAPDAHEDDLRLSIAGAQEKTALLWHEGAWCKPLSATPTTHIFKLPLGLVGKRRADMRTSVENEWLCARILRAYGIPVANCEVATFGESKALIVERFDRRLAQAGTYWLRLPQEDFCQATATPANAKYENEGGPGMVGIARLLAGSQDAAADIATFLKAQLVFLLLRATDGHAKNFSIFLQAGGEYRMTPLYDVLSAWPVIGQSPDLIPPQRVAMAMAWLGKNRHYLAAAVRRSHVEQTARKCGYPADPAQLVDAVIAQTPAVIAQVASELPPGFPQALAAQMLDGLALGARSLLAVA